MSESLEAFKKRLKGATSYCGSPICKRCGIPCSGVSDAMYPERYKYGCLCIVSDWENTWDKAKENYYEKMKVIEASTDDTKERE